MSVHPRPLKIGFLSTRLSGTDGVSLEVEKWSRVLQRMGHEIFYCAGELSGYATPDNAHSRLVPGMHFTAPAVQELNRRAFGGTKQQGTMKDLSVRLRAGAQALKESILNFLTAGRLDLIIVENVLAIPMNLPLGLCLAELIEETGIRAIAHHHDFYWERKRFLNSPVQELLDRVFPPDLPTLQHVTINSIAREQLELRRGISSTVVPNVHDFSTPPSGIDDYNQDFRQAIGLQAGEPFILQPTRVIGRKGIELAIELVGRLNLSRPRLYITHSAGDEGPAYWNWLQEEAQHRGVELLLVDRQIGPGRKRVEGRKIYSLWDAYPHADLITYPSLYEGFGNALLETIYFRRPAVVNRYPVYEADIRPLGFEFVELNGAVDEQAVEATRRLFADPPTAAAMAEKNYHLAQEHFSLQRLETLLTELLSAD